MNWAWLVLLIKLGRHFVGSRFHLFMTGLKPKLNVIPQASWKMGLVIFKSLKAYNDLASKQPRSYSHWEMLELNAGLYDITCREIAHLTNDMRCPCFVLCTSFFIQFQQFSTGFRYGQSAGNISHRYDPTFSIKADFSHRRDIPPYVHPGDAWTYAFMQFQWSLDLAYFLLTPWMCVFG